MITILRRNKIQAYSIGWILQWLDTALAARPAELIGDLMLATNIKSHTERWGVMNGRLVYRQ